MENQFKVGDKIICISTGIYYNCEAGKIYIVSYVYKNINHYNFINIKGYDIVFPIERFIKYSDRNKPENKKIMLELVKKKLLNI